MLFVSKYLEIVQQVFLGPAINFFKKKTAIFFLICSMVNSKKIKKKNQHEKCSNGKGGSNSTKKKKDAMWPPLMFVFYGWHVTLPVESCLHTST